MSKQLIYALPNNTIEAQQLHLSATIKARGILSGKQHKSWVGLDDFLRLSYKEFPVVIKESVQSFQHICGSEVQLIQDDPVTFPHSIDKNACKGKMNMINTVVPKCLQFGHTNIKIINLNYTLVNVSLYIYIGLYMFISLLLNVYYFKVLVLL